MKFNYLKTLSFVCTLCTMLLFAPSLWAQSAVMVSGNVSDNMGEPIIGATILVLGTTTGTITDFDGNFTISCSPKASLKISYVGYVSQTIAIAGKNNLRIKLLEDSQNLDEVVVVGYGVQRKSDLTGSVSSVKMGDAVKAMPVANITDALQGRLAGVSIISASGAPDAAASIRVRGINSFSADSGPLVVIDGFIGGSLNSLNPSDILSVEVLKDASATAIYGSRGANGVILVSTKNPEKGKTKVDYSVYANLKTPYSLPKMLSPAAFAMMANEVAVEMKRTEPYYKGDELDAILNGSQGYDYVGNMFNNVAVQQMHELSISGGNESTKFLFSGSYNGDQGIVRNSEAQRINYRLKVDTDIFKWLKVGVNFWGDYTSSQGPRFSQYRGVLIESLIYPNTQNPRNAEGKYNNVDINGSPQYNPMGHIEQINTDGYSYNSFLQGYVDITLAKGLTFRMLQGFTFGSKYSGGTDNAESYGYFANSQTSAKASSRLGKNWINSNILSYVKEFNRNNRINATLVLEQQQFDNFTVNAEGKGLLSTIIGHNNVSAAQRVFGDTESVTSTLLSGLARVNYALLNRYMITLSYRMDGSSRLAYNNRWDGFAAGAVAWDVKQEPFMKNVTLFDQFKFRFGYGETGNQAVKEYSAYSEYEIKRDADNNPVTKLVRLGNPNLRWERTAQYNGGLDLGFFNNRLTFNLDYYYKMSSDVLLEVDMPGFTGFKTGLRNTAKILNEGVELTIGADPIVTKDFSWNTNITLSNNSTSIVDLAEGKDYITISPATYENKFYRYIKGERVGTIYGYKYEGVWSTDEVKQATADGTLPKGTVAGSYKYKDLDGNNEITAEDRMIIANGQPKFNWGWTNTINYKQFDFGLFIIGYHGFDIYNYTAQARMTSLTPDPALLNRWKKETNEHATIAGFSDKMNALPETSQFVEKGDFVKVKSITLGYSLPRNILEKIHFSKARIYASIQNPFLFTGYSGIDPEVALKNPLKPGIDYGYYPNGRNYLIGINVAF